MKRQSDLNIKPVVTVLAAAFYAANQARTKHAIFTVLMLWLAFFPESPFGQETSPSQSQQYPLLPNFIETQNILQFPTNDLQSRPEPATVYVITRADIRLRGYAHLKDIFRDLPGLESTEFYTSEIGTRISIRGGSGNNKILLLLNGMRLNPPGNEPLILRSDISIRNIERIVVSYGSSTYLHGSDAVTAVINVITDRAPSPGNIGFNYGHQQTREAWVSFAVRKKCLQIDGHLAYYKSDLSDLSLENLSWWLDYSRNYEGLFDDPDTDIVEGPLDPEEILSPARWDHGVNAYARVNNKNTTFQIWHRRSSRNSSEGLSFFYIYLDDSKWEDRATTMNLSHNWTISPILAGHAAVTYNRYEILPGTKYTRPISSIDVFKQDNIYARGNEISARTHFSYQPNPRLTIHSGIHVSRHDLIPRTTIPDSLSGHTDQVVQESGIWQYYTDFNDSTSLVAFPRTAEVEYTTSNAFLEAGWLVSEPLTIVVGGSLGHHSDVDEMAAGARLATLYQLSGPLTIKFLFNRVWVNPTANQMYATFDDGRIIQQTNEDLIYETGLSHEINLTYQQPYLQMSLSGYYHRQDDVLTDSDFLFPDNIVLDEVYATRETGQERILVQTANCGESTAKGADVFAKIHLERAHFWGSYSYAHSNRTVNNVTYGLDKLSQHNIRLGLSYAMASNLFFSPSFSIRSTPQNIIPDKLYKEIQYPYEFNMHVLFQPTTKWDIFVDLRNLTNHNYALGTDITLNYARVTETGTAVPQETYRGTIGARCYW